MKDADRTFEPKLWQIKNGGKYVGETNREGKMNGYGVLFQEDVLYEAYFEEGVWQGWGWELTLTYITKTKYKDGLAHGYSSVKYEDGEVFKGMLRKGVKEGFGQSGLEGAFQYKGEFKNDNWDGVGQFVDSKKNWTGLWKDGAP